MRKLLFWMSEHPALTIALCFAAAFLLLNLLAYRHARSMTHFVTINGRGRGNDAWGQRCSSPSMLERMRLVIGGIAVERPGEAMRPEDFALPYEVHDYPGGEGGLTAWHVPRASAVGRVVLFHGYAADKARLLPEARGFHELGYACFLVDFRGSGDSDGLRTSIGYHEADDVARSVAYVRRCWPNERLIVFGQSMGAAAVLRALGRGGVEADAAVLECPFDRLLSAVRARFAAVGLPAFPAAHLLVLWGGALHGFNGFAHNPVEYARQVACPVLLLHGDCDNRVSCRQVESIYRNLAGPKQLRLFAGAGHQSHAATRPDEWKECVGRFLRGLG
jgi:alpha-beta hydrolase superfamily lysophospholipase